MVQLKAKQFILPLIFSLGGVAHADENLDNLAFLTMFNNLESIDVKVGDQTTKLAVRVMPIIRRPAVGEKRSSMETTCVSTSAETHTCNTTLRVKAGETAANAQDYKYRYSYNLATHTDAQGTTSALVDGAATEVAEAPLPATLMGQFPTVEQSTPKDRVASAALKTLVLGAEVMSINVGAPQPVPLNLFMLKQMKPADPTKQRIYSTMSSTTTELGDITGKVVLQIQTYAYDLDHGAETPAANGEKTIKAEASVTAYSLDAQDAKKDTATVDKTLKLVP